MLTRAVEEHGDREEQLSSGFKIKACKRSDLQQGFAQDFSVVPKIVLIIPKFKPLSTVSAKVRISTYLL